MLLIANSMDRSTTKRLIENKLSRTQKDKQQMSPNIKRNTTCFTTTIPTEELNLGTAINDSKPISSEHKQQSQLLESNGHLSNLVIANLHNHDHRYSKNREQEQLNQIPNGHSHQTTPTKSPCRTNTVDYHSQGLKRKKTSLVDDNDVVISSEKKSIYISNHKTGKSNPIKIIKTLNNGCSITVDKTNTIASSGSESITFKYTIGQKVLVYEPDETKARVLYDAKVVDRILPLRDKRKHIQYTLNGKKTCASIARQSTCSDLNSNMPKYLIHFSGWSSSWDRLVGEDTILCDTEANRVIQIELAKKAAAHLKKNKIKLNKIPAIIKEQVMKTELGNQPNSMNSSSSTFEDSLHCYYRDPRIYLDQALKYRHDHSYALDAIYATTCDSNLKSHTDSMYSLLDGDSTAQSTMIGVNGNRRANSSIKISPSAGESKMSQNPDGYYTFCKLPNQFKRFLENDRKKFEANLLNPLRQPNSNLTTRGNSEYISNSNLVMPVYKIIENACRHIGETIQLDSGNLDVNTVQLLKGNFEGLLGEFKDSLGIYFDILANNDYLYYNNDEKQQYSSRNNLRTINITQTGSSQSDDGNDHIKSLSTSFSVIARQTNELNRPIHILNLSHLIRFIVLLPEFLNATPDLTWKHKQIISFFLNQFVTYLIDNNIESSTSTHKERSISKKKLKKNSTKS